MKNFSLKDSGLGFLIGISLSMGLFITTQKTQQVLPKIEMLQQSEEMSQRGVLLRPTPTQNRMTFNIPENSIVIPRPEVVWSGGEVGTSRADLEGQIAIFMESLEAHFDKYSDYYTEKNNSTIAIGFDPPENPYKQ